MISSNEIREKNKGKTPTVCVRDQSFIQVHWRMSKPPSIEDIEQDAAGNAIDMDEAMLLKDRIIDSDELIDLVEEIDCNEREMDCSEEETDGFYYVDDDNNHEMVICNT